MGIISLVGAILGFFTGLFLLPALIVGIIGLNKVKPYKDAGGFYPNEKAKTAHSFNLAGVLISAIILGLAVIGIFLFIIIMAVAY
jgi:hypothetical protein